MYVFYLDARRNEPIHACSIVGPDTCCWRIFTVNVLTALWLASSICGLHCCSRIYIHEPRRESGRDGVGAASVMPCWSSACTHEGVIFPVHALPALVTFKLQREVSGRPLFGLQNGCPVSSSTSRSELNAPGPDLPDLKIKAVRAVRDTGNSNR